MVARSSAPSGGPPQVILASASPRRRDLLSQLAVPFQIVPAHIDERVLAGETPCIYTRRVSLAKAQHVARQFPAAVVLGADSVVVLGQQILGKPQDVAEARAMLTRLSGRQHTVMTGLAVLHQAQQLCLRALVTTLVSFRTLSPEMIERYIATGEPMDKAGAYAIQGAGAAFVEARQGCYTNVIGLPLRQTASLLRQAGIRVPIWPGHNAQTAL